MRLQAEPVLSKIMRIIDFSSVNFYCSREDLRLFQRLESSRSLSGASEMVWMFGVANKVPSSAECLWVSLWAKLHRKLHQM